MTYTLQGMGFFEEPLFWIAAAGLGYYYYTQGGQQGGNDLSFAFTPTSNAQPQKRIVMIYSKSCPACEYMLKKVLVDSNMKSAGFQKMGTGIWAKGDGSQIFQTVSIESDEGDDMFEKASKKYKFDGIPAFVEMGANGDMINGDVGVKEWDEFLGMFAA